MFCRLEDDKIKNPSGLAIISNKLHRLKMTLRRKDFLKRRGLLEEGNQWKKWKNNKACHIQPANK